jgi:hypothetical protein
MWTGCWVELNDVGLGLNNLYEKASRPASRDLARQAILDDIILYFGCFNIDSPDTCQVRPQPKEAENNRLWLEGYKLDQSGRLSYLFSLAFK